MSIREAQVAAISKLLRRNSPTDPDQPAPWTVLVLDDYTTAITASVLSVQDLRNLGVASHFNIKAKRHAISSDVLYFIRPSKANLDRISEDIAAALYSKTYINFSSSVPRVLLESFGEAVVANSESIAQVFDQSLDFICASVPDAFSLNIEDAYHVINSINTTDEEMEALLDRVVSGLFCVCVTMDVIPYIRCTKDSASAEIAKRLDRKLRDNALQRSQRDAATSRPVMVLLDRADLVPMLAHSWIYQSLVADTFIFTNNEVKLRNGEGVAKSYSLTEQDRFWLANAAAPFPQVAEAVGLEWQRYQTEADNLTRQGVHVDDTQQSAALKSAINLLPELRARKVMIENHMQILEGIMQAVKDRQLDKLFHVEADLNKATQTQILDMINDPALDPIDKQRLFIQFYLTRESDLSSVESEPFITALTAAGADISAIQHVKAVRQHARMAATTSQPTQTSFGFSNIFKESLEKTGLSVSADAVLAGLSSFRPPKKTGSLTQLCQALMEPQTASKAALSTAQNFLLYDPLSSSRGILPSSGRTQTFTEALVFVTGGGSFDEMHNLNEFAQGTFGTTKKKRIVYGSTSLSSPNSFLNELTKLGKEA